MKLNLIFKLRAWKATRKSNRYLRKDLRAKGFHIYPRKYQAIRKAKDFTYINKEVYWVLKEIGYYAVVNVADIDRLNNNSLKHKGGYKIRTRDLDKTCVWRSPKYSKL